MASKISKLFLVLNTKHHITLKILREKKKKTETGRYHKIINVFLFFPQYVEQDLISGMFWEKYYNGKDVHHSEEGYIYFENRLMGRARLRQLRVRDHTCP